MLRSSFSSSLSVLGTEQRVDVPPRDTENLGVPSSRAGEETVVAEEGEGEGMTELEHVLFLLEQESDKEVLRDVLDAVLAQVSCFLCVSSLRHTTCTPSCHCLLLLLFCCCL